MKKQALTILAMAGLLAIGSVVSLHADSDSKVRKVRADIPFAFVVGNETLPAGTYTAKYNSNETTLVIQNLDHSRSAVSFTNAVRKGKSVVMGDDSPKLIFNRDGDQYVLAQVWVGGGLGGRELQ